VFTHVRACTLADSQKEPLTSEAPAASLLPRLLQLLPAGATGAGWVSHPLGDVAFPRRTLRQKIRDQTGNTLIFRPNLTPSEKDW